jgi:nucleotide-binding universal stress UspA family protein
VKNILIPVDKNSEENTTIDEAVKLAKKYNSKITLLNVDNRRKLLAEINNRRMIDDERMIRLGDHGLVNPNNMPGSTTKDKLKDNTQDYSMKKELQEEQLDYRNFLDDLAKLYEKEGLDTETIITEGDPASAILDETEKGDYDMVIMKTHTMKERKRFMLGSVTNKVVHHVNIPILIIR